MKCWTLLRWVKASSWCSAAIVRLVVLRVLQCPTVATNMRISPLSFLTYLTCPHLLFDHSPRPDLFLKASDHTCFPFISQLLHSLACADL